MTHSFWVLLALLAVQSLTDGQHVVETNQGSLRGANYTDTSGRSYISFLGVPFATPPVGELRWQKPQPPSNWSGVRDALELSPSCEHLVALFYGLIGVSNETSEDCLYLNVYVPGNSISTDTPKAVMLFIYGGAYLLGTTSMYPPQILAITGDVIVVAPNYRVGTIGFLTTEDDAARGNYGLWDVQAALVWVQENIAAFGGDPNKVTVFGQSAGGAMTSHMMISPTTKGLINRGISISGSSSGFFGVASPGGIANTTRTLGRLVGCRRPEDSFDLVACLKELPPKEVNFYGFLAATVFNLHLPNYMPWMDGEFVSGWPRDSWANGSADHLDFISGHCNEDAAAFVLGDILGYNSSLNLAATNNTLFASLSFATNHYPGGLDCVDAIYEEYPLLESEDLDTRTKTAVEAATDWWFAAPAYYEISQHSQSAPDKASYFYDYKYRHSFIEYRQEWVQSSHFDDLWSVFNYPLLEEYRERWLNKSDFTSDDNLVSHFLMTYYTNFAKNGDPNVGNTVPVPWPKYSSFNKEFMMWGVEPEVLSHTNEQIAKYNFWNYDFWNIAYQGEFPVESMTDEGIDLVTDEFFSWILGALSELDTDAAFTLMETVEDFLGNRQLRRLV